MGILTDIYDFIINEHQSYNKSSIKIIYSTKNSEVMSKNVLRFFLISLLTKEEAKLIFCNTQCIYTSSKGI